MPSATGTTKIQRRNDDKPRSSRQVQAVRFSNVVCFSDGSLDYIVDMPAKASMMRDMMRDMTLRRA